VSGCAGDTHDMRAQHFWGFPFYHLVPTMGIPTLPPAGRKKGRLPTHQWSSKPKLSVLP